MFVNVISSFITRVISVNGNFHNFSSLWEKFLKISAWFSVIWNKILKLSVRCISPINTKKNPDSVIKDCECEFTIRYESFVLNSFVVAKTQYYLKRNSTKILKKCPNSQFCIICWLSGNAEADRRLWRHRQLRQFRRLSWTSGTNFENVR